MPEAKADEPGVAKAARLWCAYAIAHPKKENRSDFSKNLTCFCAVRCKLIDEFFS